MSHIKQAIDQRISIAVYDLDGAEAPEQIEALIRSTVGHLTVTCKICSWWAKDLSQIVADSEKFSTFQLTKQARTAAAAIGSQREILAADGLIANSSKTIDAAIMSCRVDNVERAQAVNTIAACVQAFGAIIEDYVAEGIKAKVPF